VLVVGIGSPKGGVGKSALACQLACIWSAARSVVLVDGDQNQTAIQFHRRGHHRWKAVTPADAAAATRTAALAIIDIAGGHRAAIAELAHQAGFLLVPATPTPAAITATLTMAPSINAVTDRWSVVLTMCDGRRAADTRAARDLLIAAGVPVLLPFTTRQASWERAEASGVALGDVRGDPRRMTAHSQIKAIADTILRTITP
jgi:cellulose biosynthesis protein BcsQ